MRIIPAHAGQTRTPTSDPTGGTDHPRACGANVRCRLYHWRATGSSPRMRGKQIASIARLLSHRIIPAHAGQTLSTSGQFSVPTDHPRACGANVGKIFDWVHSPGSSPRMRGKPVTLSSVVGGFRIIPAHAGQTTKQNSRNISTQDHPRACGANILGGATGLHARGSSPRMRGKHMRVLHPQLASRIIPAHAGQTADSQTEYAVYADHPRACGANRRYVCGEGGLTRIIPAHAGQTTVVVTIVIYLRGSSPRMRGKPSPRLSVFIGCPHHPRACGANRSDSGMRAPQQPIIPAHAGQTRVHEDTGQTILPSSPRMRGKQNVQIVAGS